MHLPDGVSVLAGYPHSSDGVGEQQATDGHALALEFDGRKHSRPRLLALHLVHMLSPAVVSRLYRHLVDLQRWSLRLLLQRGGRSAAAQDVRLVGRVRCENLGGGVYRRMSVLLRVVHSHIQVLRAPIPRRLPSHRTRCRHGGIGPISRSAKASRRKQLCRAVGRLGIEIRCGSWGCVAFSALPAEEFVLLLVTFVTGETLLRRGCRRAVRINAVWR